MKTRGRPRLRKPKVPAHIDAAKLPAYCYWDSSGSGHWYTVFTADGKQKRTKIAGPDARLSDLHKAMEQRAGRDVDCINWLFGKFKASVQYTQVAIKTRKDWDYCARVISETPTRVAGVTAGQVPLSAWNPPQVQKLVDQIGDSRGPSTAAHCARFLRRLYGWAVNRGHAQHMPIGKLELPKERKQRRLPEAATVAALVAYAQTGACAGFIWQAVVLAYRCRLRGVEVFDLTDASLSDDGILCARRKGSSANVTRWTPELRAVVAAAQAERNARWERLGKAIPLRPEQRPLLTNSDGARIKAYGWQNAWRRFQAQAVGAGIITEAQRFGLHDMKRRGVTDTKGTKADKLDASGHKTPGMLAVYDFSVPRVDAAGD